MSRPGTSCMTWMLTAEFRKKIIGKLELRVSFLKLIPSMFQESSNHYLTAFTDLLTEYFIMIKLSHYLWDAVPICGT